MTKNFSKYVIFLLVILGCSNISLGQTPHYIYLPVKGKVVGVWPNGTRISTEGFKELKNRWGITGVFITCEDYWSANPSTIQYQFAVAAGFDWKNLMVGTWDDNYIYSVDSIPAGYYYLGECVEHDCYGHPTNEYTSHIYSPAELTTRTNYVHSKRPDSKFVIDGFKRCSHLIKAATCVDLVMYSSYNNWNSVGLPVCHVNVGWGDAWESPWVTGDDNQSGSWQDMKSKFGAKFSQSWMKAGADEYNSLFVTANQLGLTAIWFYELEGANESNFTDFCNAACQNGWMTRVDISALEAPTGLTASTIIPGEIILNWKVNSLYEKGFKIERKQLPNGNYSVIDSVGAQINTYTDAAAGDTAQYSYRVAAYSYYGQSDYSNEVTIKSLLRPAPALVYPPDKFLCYTTGINFLWNKVKDVKYYHYQYAADSLFTVLYPQDSLRVDTSITIGALVPNVYYWRVGAKFENGRKYWSQVRSFTVFDPMKTYTVKGSVTYNSSGATYPISNVKVLLSSTDGTKTYSADVNTDGTYTISGIISGNYTIAASKTGDWGGVNSADALLASKFYAGIEKLNPLQLCAGDVNNNGSVNNSDALLIMNMYIGTTSTLPNNKPQWVFTREENIQYLYSSIPGSLCTADNITITNSDMTINLKALCSGDINGSRTK